MNILIVGNGFDLSHYLPTKYDHFMVAMQAIQKWNILKGDMCFDDLFASRYETENWFFKYTKAIYRTEDIKINLLDLQDLKKKLQENVWYQYFLHHITTIDTWIDFENEFSKALDLVAIFTEKVEEKYKKYEKIDPKILSIRKTENDRYIYYGQQSIHKLKCLKILDNLSEVDRIASNYYRNKDLNLDINSHLIIEDLEKYLSQFIDLFKFYLRFVVENLKPIKHPLICAQLNIDQLLIFSFNYTTTFEKLYEYSAQTEYVHGNVHGQLVLGISDLKNEFLKKFKNYSFTKYHQKLLKNTDYLFLRENPSIKKLLQSNSVGSQKINITIWGHSLADSDESYIKEIFSLNEKLGIECNRLLALVKI